MEGHNKPRRNRYKSNMPADADGPSYESAPTPVSSASPEPGWQDARRQHRIKLSDTRKAKKAAAKNTQSHLPEHNFDYSGQTQPSEKFNQRQSRKGKFVPWVSEQDRMGGLGLRVLDGRHGGSSDGMEMRIQKNPLVAK